jgi:hypothetical protein
VQRINENVLIKRPFSPEMGKRICTKCKMCNDQVLGVIDTDKLQQACLWPQIAVDIYRNEESCEKQQGPVIPTKGNERII